MTAGCLPRPAARRNEKNRHGISPQGGGLAAAARRECSRRLARCHVRRLHGADRLSILLQSPDRLDHRTHPDHLAVARALGCGLRGQGKRGNPDRSRDLDGQPPHAPRPGIARHRCDRRPVSHLAAGDLVLCQLHEGGEIVVSEDSDELALFDLPFLRRCRGGSLSVAVWDLLRGKAPDEPDPAKTASGL